VPGVGACRTFQTDSGQGPVFVGNDDLVFHIFAPHFTLFANSIQDKSEGNLKIFKRFSEISALLFFQNITHLGDDIPPKQSIIINYLITLIRRSDISTIPGSVVDYLTPFPQALHYPLLGNPI
jgi:hypothetical protein